jgi:hypothetical protein
MHRDDGFWPIHLFSGATAVQHLTANIAENQAAKLLELAGAATNPKKTNNSLNVFKPKVQHYFKSTLLALSPRARRSPKTVKHPDFESKLTKSKLRGNLKVLLKKEVVQ